MTQATLGAETETLLAYLDHQREHVLGILEGLDDDALRRPVLPSGWTCLGLVQHLSRDIEYFWFRGTVAAEPDVTEDLIRNPGDAWKVAADTSTEAVCDGYRMEIARANAVIAATPLDAAPAWWPPELFGGWRLDTVRQIVLHVITETATHAGHLDAVRELIDGRRWMVLD